jgi:aldehyde:ferredoxin oxidoreductase
MGAIMGSKNIKAIAVKGNNEIPASKPTEYKKIRSIANRNLREDIQSTIMRELGTSATADYFDYIEELPKRYFRLGKPNDELRTSGVGLKESILTGVSACHACVIACGRVVSLNKKDKRKGPEYETMAGFGPNLLINDPIFVTLMGELCDRHGIDTISMSNLVGLVFHLFDKGIITEKDTDGLCFRWGDQSNVEHLINLTVRREGFGYWVAEGARALASRFDALDEAVQVNGLEAPYHDPRGGTGMALVYATSPRGACHNQSDYFIVDLGQVESELGMEYFDRHAGSEKAANVAIHQNWITLFNSLVMCLFAHVPPDTVLELTNAASGSKYSIQDLLRAGERGWNLKRVINFRMGLRKENDRLPKVFSENYTDSSNDGKSEVPDIEAMLNAYYHARGWDQKTGYPTITKVKDLNMDWILDDVVQTNNFSS